MPLSPCCGRRKKTKSPDKDTEMGQVVSTSDQAVKPATSNVKEGTKSTEIPNQESRKDRNTRILKRVAALGWQGFKLSLEVLEGFSSSVPILDSVVTGLQAVVDIYDRIDSNKETVKVIMERLDGLLEILGRQADENKEIEAVKRCTEKLSGALRKVKQMEHRGVATRVLNSSDDEAELDNFREAVNAAIQALLLDLGFDTRDMIKDIQKENAFHQLPFATAASFTAVVSEGVSRGSCTIGTRAPILDDILHWACAPAAPSVLWLRGLAGQGKTTIAYTVCKRLADVDCVSYFCSRQLDSGKVKLLVPTLVLSLAKRSSSFASKLAEAIDAGDRLGHDVIKVQMQKLLVEPWQQSVTSRARLPPIVVVIDGLDESGDGVKFIEELATHINELPGLRFLCTSRPDHAFRPSFEGLGAHVIDLNPAYGSAEFELVDADIKRYLREVLPAHPEKEDVVTVLAKAADGLFVFAATVIRAAVGRTRRSEKEIFSSIRRLVARAGSFKDASSRGTVLDQLYAEILSSALTDLDEETVNNRQYTLLVFLELSRIHPITPWFLGRVASNDDEKLGTIVVESLHAVLYIEETSGHILTCHASFGDYIAALPSSFSPSPLLAAATTALRFVYADDPDQRPKDDPDDVLRSLIPFPRDPDFKDSEQAVLDGVYSRIFAHSLGYRKHRGPEEPYFRFLHVYVSLRHIHELGSTRFFLLAEVMGPEDPSLVREVRYALRRTPMLSFEPNSTLGATPIQYDPAFDAYIARCYAPSQKTLLSLHDIGLWWDFIGRTGSRDPSLHESPMPVLPSNPSDLAFGYLQLRGPGLSSWGYNYILAHGPVPQKDELLRLRSQCAAEPEDHRLQLKLCQSLHASAQGLRQSGEWSAARADAAASVEIATQLHGRFRYERLPFSDMEYEWLNALASTQLSYALCLALNGEYVLAKEAAAEASLQCYRVWTSYLHHGARTASQLQYLLALHLYAFVSQ